MKSPPPDQRTPWYRSYPLWLMAGLFLLLVIGCVHLIMVSQQGVEAGGGRSAKGTVLGVPITRDAPREQAASRESPPETE